MLKNKWVRVLGVPAFLVAALLFVIFQSGAMPAGTPKADQMWFYDLNNGQLFSAVDQFPPIASPTGPDAKGNPAGVRAYVFSCGSCADPAQRFVGYLETFPDEAHQKAVSNFGSYAMVGSDALTGMLVRREADTEWVSPGSEEGAEVTTFQTKKCPGNPSPNPCPGPGAK